MITQFHKFGYKPKKNRKDGKLGSTLGLSLSVTVKDPKNDTDTPKETPDTAEKIQA